jgi:hypothetical protein
LPLLEDSSVSKTIAFGAGATAIVLLLAVLPATVLTQGRAGHRREQPAEQQDEKKLPQGEEVKKVAKAENTLSPVEIVVELCIVAFGGRKQLETARSSISEEGTIRLVTDQGDLSGKYLLRSMRGAKSWDDLLRVDLDLTAPASTDRPGGNQTIKYTIAFNGASVWSAQNGQYITPRPEAEGAFKAQLSHEYTTLLRYKEDGSKIELVGPETIVGISTNVVDLTTTTGEKTRYWISSKSYRVIRSEYELTLPNSAKPTKYQIKYFYTPLRVVQNTLVPSRREMSQDGKVVQEISLGPITYSAKLDPEVFQHLQEQ